VTSDLDVAGAKPMVNGEYRGNGAPSGPHFNLNIIGVPRDKSIDETAGGHVIFVDLVGRTRINLAEGDFAVLDKNGTDGVAAFQLPNPDENCDGITEYSVFVAPRGKPGGVAHMQTCYYADLDGSGVIEEDEVFCAEDVDSGVSEVVIERTKGQQKFSNESKNLLYVDYCTVWEDTDLDGEVDTCTDWDVMPLFGDDTENFFWEYDNAGLRLAQLRFYPDIATEAWSSVDPDGDGELDADISDLCLSTPQSGW
jgi:hypothetical protein